MELPKRELPLAKRFGKQLQRCVICNKKAYAAEQRVVGANTYHKDCFRCSKDGYAFHYSIVQHFAFIRAGDDALAEQAGRAQDDASDLRWFTLQELKAGSLTIGGDVVGVLEWVQTLIASGCIAPQDAVPLDQP